MIINISIRLWESNKDKRFYIYIFSIIIMSVCYIYYVKPHHVAYINVVYNGTNISSENIDVYYYLDYGQGPKEVKLSPRKDGLYVVWTGNYGFNNFIVKIKPTALGIKGKKVIGYSFSYFTNSSMYETTSQRVEIMRDNGANFIKGKVTIKGEGDRKFIMNENVLFKLIEGEEIIGVGEEGV